MTKHFSYNAETIAAMEEAQRGDLPAFNSIEELLADLNADDAKYPGWARLLIWLVLGTLSWVPIVSAIYLVW
jgi:hypothetical protein